MRAGDEYRSHLNRRVRTFVLGAAGVAAIGIAAAAPRAAAPAVSPAPGTPAWVWRLPPGFPEPRVPADNPMSAAKVELGRRLFHDRRLSLNRTQACADCHRQSLAFTDGRARALGSTGAVHRRSVPSLANVGYAASLTWADGSVRRLEDQARIPLLGTDPVEMGFGGREGDLEARLRDDPAGAALFASAFPGEAEPVTLENVTRALAAFERTLVSGGSAYDRLVYQGRMDALSEAAWRGLRLFFSERTGCAACHGGLLFSGGFDYDRLDRPAAPRFFDNGLLEASERRGPAAIDAGLARATGRRRDRGLFKTPTLRNIAVTAPYMHDGRIATLEGVLDHYARPASPHPQGGGTPLQPSEREDLLEFLRSLTDEAFLAEPAFGDSPAGDPGR